MSLYELPKLKLPKIKLSLPKPRKFLKNRPFRLIILIILLSSFFGFLASFVSNIYFSKLFEKYIPPITNVPVSSPEPQGYTPQERAVIKAVKESSPAVVSIIISKNLPIYEQYYYNPFPDSPFNIQIPGVRQKGTQKQDIGGGSGFIVSEDGLILTNKHVVLDEAAEYTVITNDGEKYPAKVLARDPVQDIALLKIEPVKSIGSEGEASIKLFPTLKLGDSGKLQIGQTVIAIGNALAEFRNTVSVGVISGLGRTIVASGNSGFSETLENLIQTDAAINAGNSGGPLLNSKGEVIGINTAMATGAQDLGFALPINRAKRDIEQVKTVGKISYPFLGVRYVLIDEKVKQEKKLTVDSGVLVLRGKNGEPAITSGSAAEKAGVKEGDIILEFNSNKITADNSLASQLADFKPGDKATLKILRNGEEIVIDVILGEKNE